MEVNLNAAECVKTVSNIGSTTYTNICNGSSQLVPWGTGDWIGNLFLGGFILFMVAIIFIVLVILGKLMMEPL